MVKKRRLSRNAIYPFKAELLFSDAYVDLQKSARDLLHCMVFELRFAKQRGRTIYPNNGSVSFTEVQFKEEFGCASNTYLLARNRLIRNGLIRQTYQGGTCRGDMATYKVLITPDLNPREMRWLRYPDENWDQDIPRSKTRVGLETLLLDFPSLRKWIAPRLEKPTIDKSFLKVINPSFLRKMDTNMMDTTLVSSS